MVKALEGIEVESLSGRRSWREDHIQMCNFYQGITTHKNSYDFVTINPIEVVSTKQGDEAGRLQAHRLDQRLEDLIRLHRRAFIAALAVGVARAGGVPGE